jgi:hypothetical protein
MTRLQNHKIRVHGFCPPALMEEGDMESWVTRDLQLHDGSLPSLLLLVIECFVYCHTQGSIPTVRYLPGTVLIVHIYKQIGNKVIHLTEVSGASEPEILHWSYYCVLITLALGPQTERARRTEGSMFNPLNSS